jgi:hypothetical protein
MTQIELSPTDIEALEEVLRLAKQGADEEGAGQYSRYACFAVEVILINAKQK